MAQGLFPRVVDRLLERELLSEFPALFVVGPRGCGKSTSMSQFADTILDLSIPGVRSAVAEDPDGVLAASPGTVLVDEWQEAPEILGAVKRAVDTDRSGASGRFIVTGSVRAAYHAATWPGTGRLIRVRMYGLTQGELEQNNVYNPINTFFSEAGFSEPGSKYASKYKRSELKRSNYISRIVAGRFPDVVERSETSRFRWFESYTEQLVDRDATQIAGGNPRPRKLRAVLSSCATRTAQELNKGATAGDADVAWATADSYISLLEDLSVIIRVPPWHHKRLARLNRSPKVHVTDPGLASHLLNMNATTLTRDATLVGQLFETFAVTELVTHLETVEVPTALFHLRNRDGIEVDVVLERHGQVVGIEVKSSMSVGRADAKGLIWLRDKLQDSFRHGIVLYSGEIPFQIDDRIWAAPLSVLWHPQVATARDRCNL